MKSRITVAQFKQTSSIVTYDNNQHTACSSDTFRDSFQIYWHSVVHYWYQTNQIYISNSALIPSPHIVKFIVRFGNDRVHWTDIMKSAIISLNNCTRSLILNPFVIGITSDCLINFKIRFASAQLRVQRYEFERFRYTTR